MGQRSIASAVVKSLITRELASYSKCALLCFLKCVWLDLIFMLLGCFFRCPESMLIKKAIVFTSCFLWRGTCCKWTWHRGVDGFVLWLIQADLFPQSRTAASLSWTHLPQILLVTSEIPFWPCVPNHYLWNNTVMIKSTNVIVDLSKSYTCFLSALIDISV